MKEIEQTGERESKLISILIHLHDLIKIFNQLNHFLKTVSSQSEPIQTKSQNIYGHCINRDTTNHIPSTHTPPNRAIYTLTPLHVHRLQSEEHPESQQAFPATLTSHLLLQPPTVLNLVLVSSHDWPCWSCYWKTAENCIKKAPFSDLSNSRTVTRSSIDIIKMDDVSLLLAMVQSEAHGL